MTEGKLRYDKAQCRLLECAAKVRKVRAGPVSQLDAIAVICEREAEMAAAGEQVFLAAAGRPLDPETAKTLSNTTGYLRRTARDLLARVYAYADQHGDLGDHLRGAAGCLRYITGDAPRPVQPGERIESGVTFEPVEGGGYDHGAAEDAGPEERLEPVKRRPRAPRRVATKVRGGECIRADSSASGSALAAASTEVDDDEPGDVNSPGGLPVMVDPRSPCVWARGCTAVHCPLFPQHLRKAIHTRPNTTVCRHLVSHVTGKAVPAHLAEGVGLVANSIAGGREGSQGLRGMLWPKDGRKPGVVYKTVRKYTH